MGLGTVREETHRPRPIKDLLAPWTAANQLFGPEASGSPSFWSFDSLQVLSIMRSLVGLFIVEAVYDHFRVDYAEIDGVNIYLYLIASMGVTVLLSIVIAARKRNFSRESIRPGIRAAVGLLVMGAVVPLNYLRDLHNGFIGVTIGLLFEMILIWYIIFWTVCVIYWLRYPFGDSETYPPLGPIVTGATVIVLMLISLIQGDSDAVPDIIWLGVTLAGVATSLALVSLELHLLRRNSAHRAETSPPKANGQHRTRHFNA
jgi:hypothetical protein